MPWLDDMTWARSAPALASATPKSRYLKKSRRPLTSTGSAARAWATFCLAFCGAAFAGAALGRDFRAAADGIVSSLRVQADVGTVTPGTGGFKRKSASGSAPRKEALDGPDDAEPEQQHESGAAQQDERQAQRHAAVGPVDMGRRLAPRREPEGARELEVIEPVARPHERRQQPQANQAAPPVHAPQQRRAGTGLHEPAATAGRATRPRVAQGRRRRSLCPRFQDRPPWQ